MKPTVDSIMKKHNIRIYNGSWYIEEEKLRKTLQGIIDEVYREGKIDALDEQYFDDRGQAPGN